MRTTLVKFWNRVRASYWFVPTLMTLAAVLVAIATTQVDKTLPEAWHKAASASFFTSSPAGARALLGTVAGSMITVAGVTFSITIVAVSYAAANLGPRLMSNFMRDVSNQVTLGTFIATFIYCLLILGTVLGGDGEASRGKTFVPFVGMGTAMAFTLASLGVLINFIHHVPRSISVFDVVARLGEELCARLTEPFPCPIGAEPADPKALPDMEEAFPHAAGQPVRTHAHGYLTHFEAEALIEAARAYDVVLRFVHMPGDFVGPDEVICYAHGAAADETALHDAVRAALIAERERTPYQDLMFIAQQLAQISARALSPGVNDPYTANGCVNWLGTALIALGNAERPSLFRMDGHGRLRVIAPRIGFRTLAVAVFDELRPYVGSDRNAAFHMLSVMERVRENLTDPEYRAVVRQHAEALKTEFLANDPHPRDRDAFDRLLARMSPA